MLTAFDVTLTYADTGSGELVRNREGAGRRGVRQARGPRYLATRAAGPISVRDMHGKCRVGATLIEDGAITTDKILANAITAGKIAALAIEADHISANAYHGGQDPCWRDRLHAHYWCPDSHVGIGPRGS